MKGFGAPAAAATAAATGATPVKLIWKDVAPRDVPHPYVVDFITVDHVNDSSVPVLLRKACRLVRRAAAVEMEGAAFLYAVQSKGCLPLLLKGMSDVGAPVFKKREEINPRKSGSGERAQASSALAAFVFLANAWWDDATMRRRMRKKNRTGRIDVLLLCAKVDEATTLKDVLTAAVVAWNARTARRFALRLTPWSAVHKSGVAAYNAELSGDKYHGALHTTPAWTLRLLLTSPGRATEAHAVMHFHSAVAAYGKPRIAIMTGMAAGSVKDGHKLGDVLVCDRAVALMRDASVTRSGVRYDALGGGASAPAFVQAFRLFFADQAAGGAAGGRGGGAVASGGAAGAAAVAAVGTGGNVILDEWRALWTAIWKPSRV